QLSLGADAVPFAGPPAEPARAARRVASRCCPVWAPRGSNERCWADRTQESHTYFNPELQIDRLHHCHKNFPSTLLQHGYSDRAACTLVPRRVSQTRQALRV